MYEEDGTGISRLKRIQDAAVHAIQQLKPADTLAIIAFAHNCQVLLPPTPVSEKDKIEDVIDKVDMFDVDPGGTAMDQGISMGMDEVEKLVGAGKLSQVIVLTDGETSGEQTCRNLAQEAAQKKIRFTVIGVGTEWNQSLIKDLAKLAEGDWDYIDVNDAVGRRAASSPRSSSPGRGRLPQRRDAPAPEEGRQDQARPHGRAGDQGDDAAEPEERHLVAQPGHAGERQADALHPRPEPAETARRQVQHRRHRGHLRPRHGQEAKAPARCRWR